MKTFPHIGISMRLAPHKYFTETSVQSLSEDYIQAVCAVGASPVLLPVLEQGPQLQRLLSLLDGLVISGSDNDISPCLWGKEPAQSRTQNLTENEFDLFLLRYGWSCGLPVLGICQGHELINVALGGTLKKTGGTLKKLQKTGEMGDEKTETRISHDARSGAGQTPRECLSHQVQIAPQSQLAAILQNSDAPAQSLWVNSFHGLCIDQLAPCLEATAVADDATIEALEWRKDLLQCHPFMLGVQWHPEMLCPKRSAKGAAANPENPELSRSMSRIFARLADEARLFRSTKVSERRAICFENEDLQFLPYRRAN